MRIEKTSFGTLPDGTPVSIYTLVNASGMTARITPYGGTLVSLTTPDRDGVMGDVVLGFDTLAEYLDHSPFFGCLVGRYANRIGGGAFSLEGVDYQLAKNNGPNSLHGGLRGFDKRVWAAAARETSSGPALELSLMSPNGDQGYPGTLSVMVVYTLTDAGAWRIDYTATTDKTTIVNLTNHCYFNLSAGASATVLDHELWLNADAYTPVDATLIPTGERGCVAGTPLDFRQSTRIGARIDDDHAQLGYGGGYDHNWVVNGEPGVLRLAARVFEPASGRVMEVSTTEPGVQVYTANMMQPLPGKGGVTYVRRGAICLETQHFPDSPNKPEFPSTVLAPGQTFRSTTEYSFGIEDV